MTATYPAGPRVPEQLPIGADIPKRAFLDAVTFDGIQPFVTSLRDRLGISDAILEREGPPLFIQRGHLVEVAGFTTQDWQRLQPLIDETISVMEANGYAKHNYEEFFHCDFSLKCHDDSMVRVHAYNHEGGEAVSLRIQNNTFLPFAALGLDARVLEFFDRQQGLIVFGGQVRSGKTSTVHAILEHRNQNNKHEHNIVIADPPEFRHQRKFAKVTTREIGISAKDYKSAIKSSLRIAHHILFIGEMRGDRATARAILQATNLGSLCVTTTHTNSTAQTIRRFTNIFSGADAVAMQETFNQNVIAIFNLALVPTVDGSEIMAHELLVKDTGTSGLLSQPQMIASVLDTNPESLSHSMEKHLAFLCFKKRIISEETMHAYAPDKAYLAEMIHRKDYEFPELEGLTLS